MRLADGAPITFHTDRWEIDAGAKRLQPTWTEDFRGQFKNRRGYDSLPCLPALARRVVDGREATDRALLKEHGNELVIAVANTWHNRLCAVHALPVQQRLARVGHKLHALGVSSHEMNPLPLVVPGTGAVAGAGTFPGSPWRRRAGANTEIS